MADPKILYMPRPRKPRRAIRCSGCGAEGIRIDRCPQCANGHSPAEAPLAPAAEVPFRVNLKATSDVIARLKQEIHERERLIDILRRYAGLALLLFALITPAWGQGRTETFSWAPSSGALSYRLYQCRQACWNQNDIRKAWERAAEGPQPAFVMPIPDRRTFWMAAVVYPDREIFRWNVVWYTVPGPSFVTVPPP